jgi:uncharacterized membrane protein
MVVMSLAPVFRARWGVFAALFLASLTSSLLVAARVMHTRRLAYTFLVYNLALAWIPLAFAVAAEVAGEWRSRVGAALTVVCLAGWLLFLPNAPYLMTDLMHLRMQHNQLFWMDLVALQAFAWTGLALGFVSLEMAQRVVARRVGVVASWIFASAAMGLSAFGVYLGRFRRWNSWDVARDPFGLIADVTTMVFHPFAHVHVVAFSAVLAMFLMTAYVVFHSLTWNGGTGPDRTR